MNGILAAKERDVEPLLEESAEVLELDYLQQDRFEAFLDLAWVAGASISHAHFRAEATDHAPEDCAIPEDAPKPDLGALIRESADSLNLTLFETMYMWGFLQRALVAGIHALDDQVTAALIVGRSKVDEEALRWLRERNAAE